MLIEIEKGFYDVVILPSPRVSSHAIELSQMLQPFGSKVLLTKTSFRPHLSLYHIPVADEDFDEFVDALTKLVRDHPSSMLELDGIDLRLLHRAFFLNVKRSPWLTELASEVIATGLPFYDKLHDVRSLWGNLNPEMTENFKKYGTPMAENYFIPHFTFAVLDNDENVRLGAEKLESIFNANPVDLGPEQDIRIIPKTFPPPSGTFNVDRIFIATVGPNLSCQEIVTEITF